MSPRSSRHRRFPDCADPRVMSGAMRIDLHAHSTASDGTFTPAEVMMAAAEAELDVVALTDHDTTAGWPEASAAAELAGVSLLPGVELSCRWYAAQPAIPLHL